MTGHLRSELSVYADFDHVEVITPSIAADAQDAAAGWNVRGEYLGYKYYLLPRELRYRAPQHALLRPSGLWGHGVGILATMFMLLDFVCPFRRDHAPHHHPGWMRLDPAEGAGAQHLGQALGGVAAGIPEETRRWVETQAPDLRHVLALIAGGAPARRSIARGLRQARPLFVDRGAHRGFSAAVRRLHTLRMKVQLQSSWKRLMSVWRVLHVVRRWSC